LSQLFQVLYKAVDKSFSISVCIEKIEELLGRLYRGILFVQSNMQTSETKFVLSDNSHESNINVYARLKKFPFGLCHFYSVLMVYWWVEIFCCFHCS